MRACAAGCASAQNLKQEAEQQKLLLRIAFFGEIMTEKKQNARKTGYWIKCFLIVLFLAAQLILPACDEEGADMTESAAPHETEADAETEPAEDTGDTEETETIATADPAEFQNLRVLESSYQYVNGYTWDDLYTLLAGVAQTTTGLEHRTPYMLIVRLDTGWDPLLFIGLKENGSEAGSFSVYVVDEGYLYLLMSFEDEVYYNPDTEFFYLKNAGKKYIYAPHVMLEGDAPEESWPDSAVKLPLQDISGIKISADHLEDYYLDISQGGGTK